MPLDHRLFREWPPQRLPSACFPVTRRSGFDVELARSRSLPHQSGQVPGTFPIQLSGTPPVGKVLRSPSKAGLALPDAVAAAWSRADCLRTRMPPTTDAMLARRKMTPPPRSASDPPDSDAVIARNAPKGIVNQAPTNNSDPRTTRRFPRRRTRIRRSSAKARSLATCEFSTKCPLLLIAEECNS